MMAQLLAEGMVLALAGSTAGVALARLTLGGIVRLGANAVPRLADTAIDDRVLAFSLAVSCCAGLLFGLGPALCVSRVHLADILKQGGRQTPLTGARRLLMAGEVAMASVLLIAAGLLVRSSWKMNAHPEGFAPERTVIMSVTLDGVARADDRLDRLSTVPSVEACGISNARMRGIVEAEGVRFPPDTAPQAGFHTVSAGYFRAMGMRLAAGRWLTDREPEPAVMINQAFARRVFGEANPIGRRIRTASSGTRVTESGSAGTRDVMATVVGVVEDLRYTKLDQAPGLEIYIPYRQATSLRGMDVILRATRNPEAVAAAARKTVGAPVFGVQTLEQALADSIAPRRFNLLQLGIFAGAALLLALGGIYGAVSYAVTQRTHEVGVRMALGTGQQQVVRMIVRQGLRVGAAGMIVGVTAALALAGVIRGMLYEVAPSDPWTLAGVCGILAAAVAAACWVPARRAAAVDPTVALRYE